MRLVKAIAGAVLVLGLAVFISAMVIEVAVWMVGWLGEVAAIPLILTPFFAAMVADFYEGGK